MTALVPGITSMPVTKRVAMVVNSSGNVAEDLRSRASLIAYVKAAGMTLTVMFEASRDVKKKILLASANGEIDVVLVSSVNVLGIDLAGRVKALLELSAAGVEPRSLSEDFFNFSTATSGNLLTSLLVWISEEIQAQATSKIKKGQDRARARNVKIGRPRKPVDVPRALMLLADGMPLSTASRALGISRSHLRRHLQEHQQVAVLKPNWPEANEGSPMIQQILRVSETHAEPQEKE